MQNKKMNRKFKMLTAGVCAVLCFSSQACAAVPFSFGKPGDMIKVEETEALTEAVTEEAAEAVTEIMTEMPEEALTEIVTEAAETETAAEVMEEPAEEPEEITEAATEAVTGETPEAAAEVPEETAAEEDAAEVIAELPLQEEKSEFTLPDIRKVAQEGMPAIVAITNVGVEKISYFGRQYEFDSESTGSGIIVGKNEKELLIATNNHVVDGAEDLTVCFSVDTENEEDKMVSAQVKGTESALDLAVIAVKLEDISPEAAENIGIIQMGDSDQLEVGEWAVAIGNSLGYGQSVTFGIISALDRKISVTTDNGVISNNMIQTDAAINFGNSGGALLNMRGELIGINSAKAAETGVEGMGYAIPINTAKPIIEDLMDQATREKVDADRAGALGVIPVDVSEEARQIYNIPSGAYVYELTENSAAEKAGIREGDIIVKLDKTGISSKDELLNRMQYYEAGEIVQVTIKRTGSEGYEEKVIEVILGRKADLPGYEEEVPEEQQDDAQEEQDGGEEDYNYYNRRPYYDSSDMMEEFFRYFGF